MGHYDKPEKEKKTINVGIDVGKYFLDICMHEKNEHWQVANTAEGIQRLLRRLSYYQVERLVMEATGRYEFLLANAAHEKGLAVCIVKPLSIRRFAGAMGQLAKTDKIDAAVIANFAVTMKPGISPS